MSATSWETNFWKPMVKQPKSAFKNTHVIHTGEMMFLIILLQPGSLATGTYNSRLWHWVLSSKSLVVWEHYWCICNHVREIHLTSAQRKYFYSKLWNRLIVSVISRIKLSGVRSDLLWMALLQITGYKCRKSTKNAAIIWLQAAKRRLPSKLRILP